MGPVAGDRVSLFLTYCAAVLLIGFPTFVATALFSDWINDA